MENKYRDTISKVIASEEFKNTIIQKMEIEQAKKENGMFAKIKKIISTIVSLIGILACSGVVCAAVSGKIKIGNQTFSNQYIEYEQKIENQYLEKDGARVELVSTMCDNGFLVLQFEVEFEDSLIELLDEELEGYYGLECLSFNDKIMEDGYLHLNGANYNLIIDGKNYWLKGAVDSQIVEKIENKKYTVHQLYFLPSDVVENKETFTITLGNVIIPMNSDAGKYIKMDGKFEIEVSKEKAIQNTKTITNEKEAVAYERLTHKIEKVSQTPLQTIIQMTSLFADTTARNSSYLLAEDYIGVLEYEVYDQNGNKLSIYDTMTEHEYYYEDGTTKIIPISELSNGEEHVGHNKMRINEYIVTEKNEEIKTLRIEIYERNSYKGITRNIGTHFIDLEKENITCKNKNKIIKIDENPLADSNEVILAEDIEYFDIEIEEENDILYENISCEYIQYVVHTWGEKPTTFTIILFKDKSFFNIYNKNNIFNVIEIDENEQYKIVVELTEDRVPEDIKHITDTIKLK